MIYNIWFEAVSEVFLILIAIHFFSERMLPGNRSRHFGLFLIAAITDLGADILGCVFVSYPDLVPLWANYLANSVYYFCNFAICMAVLFYAFRYYEVGSRTSRTMIAANRILLLLLALLMVLNVRTGWVFSFDENLAFKSSVGKRVIDFLCVACVIEVLALTFANRRKTPAFEFAWITGSLVFALGCVAVQQLRPDILLTGTAVSLGSMMMFLNLNNARDVSDPQSGAFSRYAFDGYCTEMVEKGTKPQLLYFDITDAPTFNKAFGEENGNRLIRAFASKLMSIGRGNLVFRFSGGSFIVVVRRRTPSVNLLAAAERLSRQTYVIGSDEFPYSVRSFYFDHMAQITSHEELLGVLGHCAELCRASEDGQPMVIQPDALSDFRRNTKLEKAVSTAVATGNIRLEIKPVYDTAAKRFGFADIELCVEDPELGIIRGAELTQVAGRTGNLAELQSETLCGCCNFIKTLRETGRKMTFEAMIVPASACSQKATFAEDVLRTLSNYSVPANQLVLSISERVATLSPTIEASMQRLSKAGIRFICDGFGMGYADFSKISSLPFLAVRLDYGMFTVSSSRLGRRILDMLKECTFETLVDGVADSATVQAATALGARLVEGPFVKSTPLASLIPQKP